MEGTRGGLCPDGDGEPVAGKATGVQVLRHVLADATSEGCQKKLGRGHSLIGGSVFSGLIEHDPVVSRIGGEVCASVVYERNFQVESHLDLSFASRGPLPWSATKRRELSEWKVLYRPAPA